MHARATTIQVYIDTSSLGINGQNWDLAFDLTDGNPASNSVSISSFAITGGALTGAAGYPMLTGNVTGNLSDAPGIVTLNDSSPVPMSFFNEYLDNANIGTLITFVLNLTDNKDSRPRTRHVRALFREPDHRRDAFQRRIPRAPTRSSSSASATTINRRSSAPRTPIA